MTKEIKIPWKDEAFTALVDDDAYELLSRHTWYIMFSGDKRPYAFIEIYSRTQGKRMLYMHHVVTGCYGQVDHIDENPLNNQFHNLRPATYQENGWNKGKPRNCRHGKATSDYKGVSKAVKTDGTPYWRVVIKTTKKGEKPTKYVRLGPFGSEIAAAKAYNQEVLKLRGKFAWLNPIPGEEDGSSGRIGLEVPPLQAPAPESDPA